jgi:hypothetical protein
VCVRAGTPAQLGHFRSDVKSLRLGVFRMLAAFSLSGSTGRFAEGCHKSLSGLADQIPLRII